MLSLLGVLPGERGQEGHKTFNGERGMGQSNTINSVTRTANRECPQPLDKSSPLSRDLPRDWCWEHPQHCAGGGQLEGLL